MPEVRAVGSSGPRLFKSLSRAVTQEAQTRLIRPHSSPSQPVASTSSDAAAQQTRRDEVERRRQSGAGQQLAVANAYSELAEGDEKAPGEEAEVAYVGVIRLGASSGSGRGSTIVARGQLDGEWV